MISMDILKELCQKSNSKSILLVLDGLGGISRIPDGKTELETASTPNLDSLACNSITGMVDPISKGITPGSGPAHLSLFGYDPIKYRIGRGVLSALGIGFDFQPSDVAARINFATVAEDGRITDRRAGRLDTEKNGQLCSILNRIKIPGVEIFVRTVKEHRAIVVFRGNGLSGDLTDSDPQRAGVFPLPVRSHNDTREAKETARLANRFIEECRGILSKEEVANMVLLRGFAQFCPLPSMHEIYKLNAAAIANYPMYRGVARLVGMTVLDCGESIEDELDTLAREFQNYDFFYLHIKKTDSYGEDGDFDQKVHIIEKVDKHIPQIMNLDPDVIVVTGDHSTPAVLTAHSWHPNPVLLYSRWCRPDKVRAFSESECINGGLGHINALDIMPLILANALRLNKFGA
ncbi:2,3-bisphosphoglycerate-independent phosphoglycerate mutase [bacterium]|nr:2,3-bisphosphoglycerate-independent phosphoglycerate mutase [bacterium]